MKDIAILFEHDEWHEPLFSRMEARKISFARIDLKSGAYEEGDLPEARLYYNMVSPSAYKRGNQRAVAYSLSLCRALELAGRKVLNGVSSIQFEMSKSAQIALMRKLKIDHPRSIVFNSATALKSYDHLITYPSILKPEQGGSGARMYLVNSWNELEEILLSDPEIWLPDNLLLLQENLSYDKDHGTIRCEFLGGEFLYAMRVVSHDTFNLCPSLVCNPDDGDGTCETPNHQQRKPEFYPYSEVSAEIISNAKELMKMAGHSSGSVEYCLTTDGRNVIYDINANSNLREPIAMFFGISAFDAIIDFLVKELDKATMGKI
jgi:glutathione synthase/RimK-type ligase-like ATP-grasp enzyme